MKRLLLSARWIKSSRRITLFVILLLCCSIARTEILYFQNFGNDAGDVTGESNRSQLSTVGWDIMWTPYHEGGVVRSTPVSNGYYMGLFSYGGAPVDQPNINTATALSQTNGVVRLYNGNGLTFEVLIFTEEHRLDRSQLCVDSISWYAAATTGGNHGRVRAAVRIADSWYVGEEMVCKSLPANDPSNFATGSRLDEAHLGASEWSRLSATEGSPFVVGENKTALPDGDITAFGLFCVLREKDGSYLMIDGLAVNGGPIRKEP